MVVLALGAALFAVGLILGFGQVTVDGEPCGKAFQRASTTLGDELNNTLSGNPVSLVGDCSDARNARVPIAWGVLLVGAALAGAGGFSLRAASQPEPVPHRI